MSKSDKSDVFLSLDDDDALIPEPVLGPNSPKSRIRALKKTVKNRPSEVLDAEILDATMVTQATSKTVLLKSLMQRFWMRQWLLKRLEYSM